jgi:Na+-translocating ferredoxin:NAD+ oxidoreductase subunit G
MAKKESSFKNMVLTLFVITAIASTALAYVYEVTKGPKAAADLAKKVNAIKEVVPEFDNNPVDEMYTVEAPDGSGMLEIYPAKKAGELVGVAVKTFTMKGFSGYIGLMVGLLPDGTINQTSVLEHKETPGLGDKMDKSKSAFPLQFNGKNPGAYKMTVKKDGGDVDAITASTITSRAFCDAVQRAYDTYQKGGAK